MNGILWTEKEKNLLHELHAKGYSPRECVAEFTRRKSIRTHNAILKQLSILALTNAGQKSITMTDEPVANRPAQLTGDLKKIQETYTAQELKILAGGGRIIPGQQKIPLINFHGTRYRLGFITDTHMGSCYFQESFGTLQLLK